MGAVVTAALAFAFFTFDLRGWELVVPGLVVALALLPLFFERSSATRRNVAMAAGVLCVVWAALVAVVGGVLFLPTAVFLFASARRPTSPPPETLPACIDEVRAVLAALVTGRYDEAVAAGRGRLRAGDVATAVAEYPYRPVVYSPTWLQESQVSERAAERGREWDVSVPFWTAEEGRSDLEARLLVRQDEEGRCEVELRDVLVP